MSWRQATVFGVLLAVLAGGAGFAAGYGTAETEQATTAAQLRAAEEAYTEVRGLRVQVIDVNRAFDETVFDWEGDGDLDVLIQVHNTGPDPIWLQEDGWFVLYKP